MGLAPASHDFVDSIPPIPTGTCVVSHDILIILLSSLILEFTNYWPFLFKIISGGNLDNKRLGVGMTMYYPVEVAGALFSAGDAHAAQGDSELDGTGIETSVRALFCLQIAYACP